MGNIYNANSNPVEQNWRHRELMYCSAELKPEADVARNKREMSQPRISQTRDNFLAINIEELSDDDKARKEGERKQP